MTPTEIRNKSFERGMSGYKVEEVRAFLDKVADYVEDLHDEKSEILKKMEVLAEKVEEYREDEDSLRAALIGAQKLGDSVVRESKKKAEAILAEATKKAEILVSDARSNIHKEEQALVEMQRKVTQFKAQILALYKQHIEIIKANPYDEKKYVEEIRVPVEPKQPDVVQTPASTPAPVPEKEPEVILMQAEEDDDGAILRFDDFRANAKEAIETIEKRKSSKFGHLNEYFGDNNPITRE